MEKNKAIKLAKKLRFSYFTSRYWLEFLCDHKRENGENLVYIKSLNGDGNILQYTPKKLVNLERAEISLATREEINEIKDRINILEEKEAMTEYFFETQDIIDLTGVQHKKNRQAIKTFEKEYDYKLVNAYDKDKIIKFLNAWDQRQILKTAPYSRGLEFCHFILDHLDDKRLRTAFVLVNDELVGFSVGELLNKKQWIALHQKIDYRYRGLGRWLFRERAKLFIGTKEFANGGAMGDEGIVEFKESLRPHRRTPYYSLKLGQRIKR